MTVKLKFLWYYLIWVCILSSCVSPDESRVLVASKFPLKEIQLFSTDKVIKRLAVDDNWLVVYASETATAIDIETYETLWETNLAIQADDPLGFMIVDDILVAISEDQALLVDKHGQKKRINLEETGEYNREIIRVAGVYPDYIYVNRFPNWELEAYSILQNSRLWTLAVGRGSTEVFYDVNTNVAYIATRYKSFYAVDNTTGEVIWQDGESTLATAYKDGVIYSTKKASASNNIIISAFDVQTRNELWENEVSFSEYVYAMTIINDLVIVSGDPGLLAINISDGTKIWQTSVGESFVTKPVKYGNMIYAKGTSHTVYAISLENGDFVGHISSESNKQVQPMYEVISGIYETKDGIVFNTRHTVMLYKER